MATTGTEGGIKSIESGDAEVLDLLRNLPDPPTANDRWSLALNGDALQQQPADPTLPRVAPTLDKQTATIFQVDDSTFRQALALSGRTDWAAGNPAGFTTQAAAEETSDPRNAPAEDANAQVFVASPKGTHRSFKAHVR